MGDFLGKKMRQISSHWHPYNKSEETIGRPPAPCKSWPMQQPLNRSKKLLDVVNKLSEIRIRSLIIFLLSGILIVSYMGQRSSSTSSSNSTSTSPTSGQKKSNPEKSSGWGELNRLRVTKLTCHAILRICYLRMSVNLK